MEGVLCTGVRKGLYIPRSRRRYRRGVRFPHLPFIQFSGFIVLILAASINVLRIQLERLRPPALAIASIAFRSSSDTRTRITSALRSAFRLLWSSHLSHAVSISSLILNAIQKVENVLQNLLTPNTLCITICLVRLKGTKSWQTIFPSKNKSKSSRHWRKVIPLGRLNA